MFQAVCCAWFSMTTWSQVQNLTGRFVGHVLAFSPFLCFRHSLSPCKSAQYKIGYIDRLGFIVAAKGLLKWCLCSLYSFVVEGLCKAVEVRATGELLLAVETLGSDKGC